MNDGMGVVEAAASSILRQDGSIKVDVLWALCQDPDFTQKRPGEPLVVLLRYLAFRDALRVFLDPPGNVGEGHYHATERALTFTLQYLEMSKTPAHGVAMDRILAGFSKSMRNMEFLRDVQQKVDQLLVSGDPMRALEDAVRQLEDVCRGATPEDPRPLERSFWLTCVTAWALRLNGIEGAGGIPALRTLYEHTAWLERRVGDRRGLRPPHGMVDPDEQSDELEDFLF